MTLRLAMRDWLAAAPTLQVRTIAGKRDPADQAHGKLRMNVLTREDAVEDLGLAVNKEADQWGCPDRLMSVPGQITPSRWEAEFLSFADVSPTLPTHYSRVLVRLTEISHGVHGEEETQTDIGSVFQSPSTDVVVVWRA